MLGYDWPRLHAALNDLPAALLLVAVLFDLAGAVTRRPSLRMAGFWTMVAGAVGGALAVVSGLQAEEHIAHGEAVHRVMETHEELALITLGVFVVLALWRIVRERRMGSTERAVVLAASLGGLGALSRRRCTAASWSSITRPASPPKCSRPRCTSGRRGITTTGARARPTSTAPTRTRRRPRVPIRRRAVRPRRPPIPASRPGTPMRPARRRTRTDAMRWGRPASVGIVAALAAASRRPPGRRFLRCPKRRSPRCDCPRARPPASSPRHSRRTRCPSSGSVRETAGWRRRWFDAPSGRHTGRRPIGVTPCASARGPTRRIRAAAR